jgi:SAM-dependent methyltransferase
MTADDNFLQATQSSYDVVAPTYWTLFGSELEGKPLDRALLVAFAEIILDQLGGGLVADIGCGPGHITSHLVELGLDAMGIDLSEEMVGLARHTYPALEFRQGSMTALELSDESLTGIVALYSIIHIPDSYLPQVFAEFNRVLRPGGVLLLAFQVGDQERHLVEWHGHPVDMHAYLRRPDAVARSVGEAGLAVTLQLVRSPEPTETMDRCYMMARREVSPETGR